MLNSKKAKKPTKAEMEQKVQAWKDLNSILVKTNKEFMNSLKVMLEEKLVKQKELEDKLKSSEEGTEQDNAEYLFVGGYVQCLKDILSGKKGQT